MSQLSYDIPDSGSLPSSSFSFSDTIGNLWGSVSPILTQGAQIWGQTQIANANAKAQLELEKYKIQNSTLGSNQPAAAQKEANKTLIEKWLPSNSTGSATNLFVVFTVVGVGLLLLVLIAKKLFK